MSDLWTSLVPLIVGSAFVPVQIVLTILFLRSEAGRITAVAWVAGMAVVRLAQGVVFGLLLSGADTGGDAGDDQSLIVPTILLVAGVLFIVAAGRALFHEDDPDAPPPRWLHMTESITLLKAFLFGAGMMLIGIKFWVFTLGAIAAIGEADLGRTESIVTYLVFVVLASSVSIVLIGLAYVLPGRSAAILDRVGQVLTDYNRWLVVGLGAVFGTWFLVKALVGYGLL